MIITVAGDFRHPVDKVWNAITEHSEMIKWFFENIPEFKAEVGFKTEFDVEAPSRIFRHQWKVLEVVENKKIRYSWEYEGIPGYGEVEFILSEKPDFTVLTLNNYGIDSFPRDYPEFSPQSCRSGWTYFIQERLASYLDSR